MVSMNMRNGARHTRRRVTPKASSRKSARRSMSTRVPYERVKDLRAALTPKDDNLLPKGKFAALKERLKGAEMFARLDEAAAGRVAIELNRLMLDVENTPAPADILRETYEIRDLASALAAALDRAHGVSISAITGVEELFPPYLLLPRGLPSIAQRDAALEPGMQTAFEPELSAGAAISEREREHGPSATRETTNRREIAYLDAYDRHLQQRSERESGERFVPWRGPPVRGTCIDPLVARLRALADLAEEGARKFGAGDTRDGVNVLPWPWTLGKRLTRRGAGNSFARSAAPPPQTRCRRPTTATS